MGNVGAIRVHPDQPSLACPGERSTFTDPIGEGLVEDVQEFFEELADSMRNPLSWSFEYVFLKEVDVTSPSPDEFQVRVVLDGQKIRRHIPWIQGEEDIIRSWYEGSIDRERLYLETTEFEPVPEKTRRHSLHSVMHPDRRSRSFKVEVWCMGKEGTRRSGELIAGIVEWMWVKPLLACRFGQKVRVHCNIEVPESGGTSAMTEPLDAYFTAEQFFRAVVALAMEEGTPGREIAHKSSMECEVRWRQDFPLPADVLINRETGQKTLNVEASRIVVSDPKGLQIAIQERFFDELAMSTFYRIHQDPVRCEYWQGLPSGQRAGGAQQARQLRLLLLKLVSEAEVKNEISGALGKGSIMF
uniref:Uncharacterized protein n=1 Tax=Alexandrium catenella TaxID=2925 RepID=A0A7S1RY68_ALECA